MPTTGHPFAVAYSSPSSRLRRKPHLASMAVAFAPARSGFRQQPLMRVAGRRPPPERLGRDLLTVTHSHALTPPPAVKHD